MLLLIPSAIASGQGTPGNLDSIINSLELKEVVVTPKKIVQRDDTITYSAASYIGKDDKTLQDLLAKMPGITVSPQGQVSFNGQWIKEFYIEGLNMLNDNYGVATRNLDARAVGSVQVMERHQGIKMLQGVEKGDAPAINIRLKESAKGVWTSILSAAAGAHDDFAWDASASLMNFSRRSQTVAVAKSNNTGNDLHGEINAPRNFTGSFATGLAYPSSPSIADRYAYDNLSHSVSLNRLWKISDDKTLSCGVNYLFDREGRESRRMTTYLTGQDSRQVVEEHDDAEMSQHFVGLNAVFKNNGRKNFLSNTFSLQGLFPDGSGTVNSDIHQGFHARSLSLKDVLKSNFRLSGGGIRNAEIRVAYDDRDGTLRLPGMSLVQSVRQQGVSSSGNVTILSMTVPYLWFRLNGGYSIEWKRIGSNLSVKEEESAGRLNMLSASVFLSPSLMLHRGTRMQVTLSLPLGLRNYRTQTQSRRHSRNYLYLRPYLNGTYTISDLWSIFLTGSYQDGMPNAIEFLPEERYINYRTVMGNPGEITPSPYRTIKASLGATYKNVLRMIFSNLSLTYSHGSMGSSEGYLIDDDLTRYYRIPEGSWSDVWQLDQSFSKGFFLWNSKISQSFFLGRERARSFAGDRPYTGGTDYIGGSVSWVASFTPFISFSTGNDVTVRVASTDGKRSDKTRYSLSSANSLTVSPSGALSIIPSLVVYGNNFSTDYRTNLFLDCTAEYRLRDVTLTLKGVNLLDSKVFRKFSDNGIISRSTEYHLRGRMILAGVRFSIR